MGELSEVSLVCFMLGETSFVMLKLGETSFRILKLGELGELWNVEVRCSELTMFEKLLKKCRI